MSSNKKDVTSTYNRQLTVNRQEYNSNTPSLKSLGTDQRNIKRTQIGKQQEDHFHFMDKEEVEQIYEKIYALKNNLKLMGIDNQELLRQKSSNQIRLFDSQMPQPKLVKQELSMTLIQESQLKHQLYIHLLKSELKKVKKKFRHFQIYPQEKSYQRLLLCFWLAVHQEKSQTLKFLYDRYELIQVLLSSLYTQANQQKTQILQEIYTNQLFLQQEDQKEVEIIMDPTFQQVNDQFTYKTPDYLKQKSKITISLDFLPVQAREVLKSKSDIIRSQQQTHSGEISPFMSDQEEKQVKEKMNNRHISNIEFNVKEIKLLLMSSLGSTLCTQLLQIALNDEENQLALIIAIYYKPLITKQCLFRTLAVKNIQFIKLLLSSEKFLKDQETLAQSDQLSNLLKAKICINLKAITMMITQFKQECIDFILSDERIPSILQREKLSIQEIDNFNNLIKAIAMDWNVPNLINQHQLSVLLAFDLEDIACLYIEKNIHQLTPEIFKEQVQRYKEKFVMCCFELDPQYQKHLSDINIIKFILNNINLLSAILNQLGNQFSQDVRMQSMITDEYEKNLITAVHNPILAITIACEIINKLHQAHSQLKNVCIQTQKKLIQLVQKIIENQDDQIILEQMLTEYDHRKKSSLVIINELNMTSMIINPKVTSILEELWAGKEIQKCNGKLQDFSCIISRFKDTLDSSNISFIYDSFGRRAISNKLRFWDVIYGSFVKPKICEQNYWFQYTYRHYSIDYLYWKEFGLSFFLVLIFQYISYSYLNFFKLENLEINGWKRQDNYLDNDPDFILYVKDLIKQQTALTSLGLILCITIFIHFAQKMVFSVMTNKRFNLDLWTTIDIVTAICNFFCLYVTISASAEDILDRLKKQNLDFYVCAVVTITWFRFFNYFLVIKKISKLLITLVTMITSTMSFFFMFVCYMIVAASIFNMRFGAEAEDMYGTFFLSVRTLFDTMQSNFKYRDFGKFERSYDIFFIIHQIITRIFMLNYLVAVLTTIYQFMIIQGEYTYIKIRFSFYKRFQNMFKTKKHFDSQGKNKDQDSYCELAMHPAPLNIVFFFLFFLTLPMSFKSDWRQKQFQFIGYFIFWLENILFLGIFMSLDLAFAVFVYFKIQIVFIIKIMQKRKAILYAIYWLFTGIFIMVYLAFKDTTNLFRILRRLKDPHREIKEEIKKQKDKHIRDLQINILNEVIESMRQLYFEIESDQQGVNQRKGSSGFNRQLLNLFKSKEELVKRLQELKKEVLHPQKLETSFTIDKDLIIMTWLKLRKNRIQQARAKNLTFNQNNQETKGRKSAVYITPNRVPSSRLMSNLTLKPSNTLIMGRKYVQQALEKNANRRRSSINQKLGQSKYSSINKFVKDFNKRHSISSKRKSKPSRRMLGSFFASNRNSNLNSNMFNIDGEYDNEHQMLKNQIAVDEQMLSFIENFLNRFIFVSKYQGHNQVNLKLCLSALPSKLTHDNFYKLQMINFVKVQMAMVSFQNQKSDQLFNYYDTRSKARIHQLNFQAAETSEMSKELLTLSLATKNKLVKLFKLEREFKKMEKKRKQEKDVIRINIQQHPDIKKSTYTVDSEKTTSLFPVVEESEFGDYDINLSKNSAIPRNMLPGKLDLHSQVSTPDTQQQQIEFQEAVSQVNHSQRRSFIDQSMEYSIQQSQDEKDEETNSNSSFTSFSDIIKEETESNFSSNDEGPKSINSQKF